MPVLTYSESIFVACAPDDLYAMVSDITRMGEWSPICTGGWWDEGGGPAVGAYFTGRNETPSRTWETRSQVSVADPGRAFAFLVNHGSVRWGYTFEATDGGTTLTEHWEFLPAGLERFAERYGDDAPTQIAERSRDAVHGIPVTLAAIKAAAER